MKNYKVEEILCVAKRFNNKKRNYLLINPLQGKHLPVSPKKSLEMIGTLGEKVAKKFPDARLVIGFAETATAIGAIVAKKISEKVFYLQTTRENFSDEENFINFLEEHSHAPEQKLFAKNLEEKISATSTIIFVDDEISTGKTLLNIIRQMKKFFPALENKKIICASIINRLTEENKKTFLSENIFCESLIEIPQKNFDLTSTEIFDAQTLDFEKISCENIFFHEEKILSNPRLGVEIGKYFDECEKIGAVVRNIIFGENIYCTAKSQEKNFLYCKNSILILGTEECMLPAMIVGSILEKNFKVFTHSTTRSPIGISTEKNYPIREGFKLKSFYDADRATFIYNLQKYDAAIILTDAEKFIDDAVKNLVAALKVHGCEKIIFVRC